MCSDLLCGHALLRQKLRILHRLLGRLHAHLPASQLRLCRQLLRTQPNLPSLRRPLQLSLLCLFKRRHRVGLRLRIAL